MKSIKNKVAVLFKKIEKSDMFPFICLFFLFLAVHLLMTTNFHDDAAFSQVPQNGIVKRMQWNYYNWSTRLIIEFIYYNLYHFPTIIWKVLDSFMLTLIGYSISRLFIGRNKRENNYIISMLILMYPLMHMMTAGWMATSANYTWVAALGLYSIIPLRMIYEGRTIKLWQYITFTAATLYAGNAEQMVCVLIAVSVLALIYGFVVKKVRAYQVIQLGLLIALFIFKITGPSNEIVNESIAKDYFIEWPSLNIIDKIYLGLHTVSDHFISNANVVFFVLTGSLALAVVYKYKDKFYRALAVFPFLVSAFLGMFNENLKDIFPGISNLGDERIDLSNFNRLAAYLPLILYMLVFISIVLALYLLFGHQIKATVAIVLFVLGIGARMVMSISPSIYASNTRTFAVTYFLFMAVAAIVIDEFSHAVRRNRKKEAGMMLRGDRIYRFEKVILFLLSAMSYINLAFSL